MVSFRGEGGGGVVRERDSGGRGALFLCSGLCRGASYSTPNPKIEKVSPGYSWVTTKQQTKHNDGTQKKGTLTWG